jgi:tetratricopeptide (TPR) repeat protein
MKRANFLLAVSVCFLLAISQYAPVAAKDTWVSVRTKNFLLVGNAGEKDIRKVGLKLEQFREVFTRLFPKIRFNTPVPTTVVVFKSDSSYAPFKPGPNIAGYFQAGPDVNYITLTTEVRGEQDPFSVIFHEYTHLLVENTFKDVPVWFNEGLAEYYSTFKITDDQKIALGSPIGNHVFLLRESKMLPLRTLFEVDHKSPHYNEKNKQGIFYAQSWALMHYLIIGKADKVKQLGKFMEFLGAQVPVDQAFQKAFGTPFEVMEKDLREYVKKDRYNVITGHFEKKIELDTDTEVSQLTEAEAQAYLGDLLLHSYRKESYTYLERALKLDPNLAMAHASLGMAYFREGKLDEANASLERAVAGNSQNYLAHYYYAFALSRAETGIVTSYPADVVAKIREHVQKAITLRPDYPESYRLLAFVSLVTGERIDEAIAAMKRVLSVSPGRNDLTNLLAQLYLRKQDVKAARTLLEQVAKSNADEENRKEAENLLKQISTYEEASARIEEMRKQAVAGGSQPLIVSTGTGSEPTSEQPTDPSSYLREVLRVPEAGETQLQATLVKIECEAKGIVFVVQTATGLLRLSTKTFDDIVITTYDPKVNGEITCGPSKGPAKLVVCYVQGVDKRAKVDGILKSVEFVPADFKLKP